LTFDSVLNTIIPPAIIILILVFIYIKAKEPLDSFFETVKGWFTPKDSVDMGKNQPMIGNYEIQYVGG
jgi:hypothetical protein